MIVASQSNISSPMKRILACIAITLFSGLLVSAVFIWGWHILYPLELKTYDWRMQFRGVEYPSGHVVIVAIDDESMEKMGRFPWSRSVFAEFARKLDGYSPRVVGYEIVFPKPEPGSPGNPDPDGEFAKALKESKAPQILGYVRILDKDEEASETIPNAATYSFNASEPLNFRKMERVLATYSRLAESAFSQAMLSGVGGFDGVVRYYTMGEEREGIYYQPLAVAMLCTLKAFNPQKIRSDEGFDVDILLGQKRVLADRHGYILLNYRGPMGSIHTIPFWKVFSGEVDKEELNDKFVMVGATASSFLNDKITPTSTSFQNLEVHATALDNILERDYYIRPGYASGLELILIWVMVLLAAIAACVVKRSWGLMCFLLLFIGYIVASYIILVDYRNWIGLVPPLLGLTLTYILLAGFVHKSKRKGP